MYVCIDICVYSIPYSKLYSILYSIPYMFCFVLLCVQSELVYMTCLVGYIYRVVHAESESEDQLDQFLDLKEKNKGI